MCDQNYCPQSGWRMDLSSTACRYLKIVQGFLECSVDDVLSYCDIHVSKQNHINITRQAFVMRRFTCPADDVLPYCDIHLSKQNHYDITRQTLVEKCPINLSMSKFLNLLLATTIGHSLIRMTFCREYLIIINKTRPWLSDAFQDQVRYPISMECTLKQLRQSSFQIKIM